MKQILLALTLLLTLTRIANAQSTTLVTSTIKDPSGTAYAFGTYSIVFTNPTTQQAFYGGVPLQPSQMLYTGQLDINGALSVSLPSNAVITPSGTQWTFRICANTAQIAMVYPPPTLPCFTSAQTISGSSQPITFTAAAIPGAGGVTTTASIPGEPGVTAVPVTPGLMFEGRFLPTENPCFAVDYSGNGRNATGCVGTSPTIIAGSGGIQCNANGAVILPTTASTGALDIFVYVGFQASESGAASSFAPIFANGNGTANNAAGFYLSSPFTAGSVTYPQFNDSITTNIGTLGPRSQTENGFYGNGVLEWQLGTGVQDRVFINGTETTYIGVPQTGSGGVVTTPYQLCGTAIGSGIASFQTYYQGQLYYAAIYSRIVNAAERAAITNYISSAMSNRGVPPQNQLTAISNNMSAHEGDSITAGSGTTNPYTNFVTLNGSWTVANRGQVGEQMSQLAGGTAEGPIDKRYFQNGALNASLVWLGTNDVCSAGFTAAQAYANALTVVRSIKSYNGIPFIATMLDRTTCSAIKNSYNTLLRQGAAPNGYVLVDFAGDANVGADAANASVVFFVGDGVHSSSSANINDIAWMAQRAINSTFGNRDFSSAVTYSSAAAAAVATTALTEATNTVTVTMTATPANCQIGNLAVVTGVTAVSGTATGYNSTAANGAGLGGWKILTRSATQITYFDNTTGLGAASVQGTVSCPQQQDADQYYIVNFGAGNTTLQPCEGYTGQNIYIRNINAGGSTLVPFGSETITGPGTTTVAAATTAILQSQLVSASAAGCNWVRLQ